MSKCSEPERTCMAPHIWEEATPELRRHCTRCGTEQTGYEELDGRITWENVQQTIYDPCS